MFRKKPKRDEAQPAGTKHPVPEADDPRIEMAYDMAVSQIDAQKGALDELRTRVGVVVSGAAVATGFLAGQSLNTTKGIPAPAWVGIVAAALLVGVCAVVLLPGQWKAFYRNAATVLDDWAADPGEKTFQYKARLVRDLSVAAQANRERLNCLYRLFTISLGLLVVDFAGWIWTLATNG